MIDEVDKCIGKGEVESSILSGSTIKYVLPFNKLVALPSGIEIPDIQAFGRNFGRSDERPAE